MDTATNQIVLSASEWGIVLELLRREQARLPVEIHHTFSRRMREELRERLRVVEDAIDKVSTLAADINDSNWAATANC